MEAPRACGDGPLLDRCEVLRIEQLGQGLERLAGAEPGDPPRCFLLHCRVARTGADDRPGLLSQGRGDQVQVLLDLQDPAAVDADPAVTHKGDIDGFLTNESDGEGRGEPIVHSDRAASSVP